MNGQISFGANGLFIEQVEELSAEAPDFAKNAWKKAKQDKIRQFKEKQALPYEEKLKRQQDIAWEFHEEMQRRGCGCHVSVGGLDSITLFLWLQSIGIDVPAISVSAVEDKSIQKIHRELGIIPLKSYKTKVEVLNTIGFPVISKKLAGRIEMIQNPTPDNETVRHAIMTGECGAQGHFAKNSRMKLPEKWLKLFGGVENENYGTDYQTAPFRVSNKCCYWLKEKPCDDWAKEHNSYPYLGIMASERGQREEALVEHGCNYYGATVIRSAPFAIFTRQDILQLALDLDVPVPQIYGEICRKPDGTLYTTRAQRTGCSMCGFGIHLEDRPHRFDRLREDNPLEWEFWMKNCCVDEATGERYGWGRVLDYIGIEWEDVPYQQMEMEFE